ncbi:MAG TPA: hypothetical protein VLB68_16755 [Pyrinomonadaceae bacterium]|nr:hypothetical protein [Pyrinomonadaceae bacterium]
MRETLIAEYHNTLARDERLTPEFFTHLKSMMRASRLLYGAREISVALRPHFLTRKQYDILKQSSEVLAGAFERVALALVSEPSRMESIGLTDREVKLALVEPKHSALAVTSRLDAFINDHDVKFVEYNAENPSSLTDQAGLNKILREVGALRDTETRYQLTQFWPAEHLLNALLKSFSEWGGSGVPNIAILDWHDLPTAHEFILLRDFFVSRGIRTIICAPEQLEYQEGRLRCGAFPIDVVYKRVIINELLASCDDSHPLISAYLAGDICLVNTFRCKLVHKKASFELLTDEANAHWFTPREREVISRTVPWTRRVTERKTQHRGVEVDLVEYLRQQRSQFILKPNDDYGGRGILFGDCSSVSAWDDALSAALEGDYVVQEKINLQTEVFPIFGESGWGLQPMYVDTNPFLFGGQVEGVMVRLSDSPVVNVTSGGGETGFFVIEGEAE